MIGLGAICGDIVGSIYEFNNIKTKDFELFGEGCNFTDDTAMSIAVADWCVHGGNVEDYLVEYGHRFPLPKGGYGGRFNVWLFSEGERKPYFSFGNGSAMRCFACGWMGKSIGETLQLAKQSAEVTHNHPEGIIGAQATATAIYKLRNGASKEEVKKFIEDFFGYDLNFTLDEIRPTYKFDVTCQGTVPQAIVCFLESTSFEDAIRNAISIGGDSDTLACICGAISEAYYEIPQELEQKIKSYLPKQFIEVLEEFNTLYLNNKVETVSGATMQINQLVGEVKDLCEVSKERPIIPICVDFDGTIVKHNYPYIGEPCPHAIEIMKELTEQYNVGWILDTMRSGKVREDAVKYLTENGIKLYGDGVNPTQKKWTDSPKAYAPFSIDDRNIGVPLTYEENQVPYVDWTKIKELITPLLDEMVKATY